MAKLRAGPLLILMLLSACTVGPDYRPPVVPVPVAYGSGQAGAPADVDLALWWRQFDDPLLDRLIDRALVGNLNIQVAAARVLQARAQERAVHGAAGPKLNANGQAGYSQLSRNALPAALAGLGGGSSGGGSPLGLPGEDFASFQLGFDASWELDLFGGQRRADDAARARVDAAIWSARDARVMLAAEVAGTYQQYRMMQRRLAVTDETLAAKRELLDFSRARAANGLTTTIDPRNAERDLAQLAAQRADLAAQADAQAHALATLLGLAPDALAAELADAPGDGPVLVTVPTGLPSELLERRPDLRAAERRLAAATADIGVATADLYPRFSLTGALQLASRMLSNLVSSDSISANGTGRVSFPLLGRASAKANVALRKAQAKEALLAYQGDVLTALRDVEDALTRLAADRVRIAQLQAAEAAARDAADSARVRYRNGLVPNMTVLEARQMLLSAQDARIQAEGQAARDQIALYKALGGGWDDRRIADDEEDQGGGS